MSAAQPMVLFVSGVSGSGKTTVGRLLGERLRWAFVDADDLHSPENVARMRAGVPLTDAEREPWRVAIRERVADHLSRGLPLVVACSALRRSFRRDVVPPDVDSCSVVFVLLDVPRVELERRLAGRKGHFFPLELLDSQFAALQIPAAEKEPNLLRVDGSEAPSRVADRIARWIRRHPRTGHGGAAPE